MLANCPVFQRRAEAGEALGPANTVASGAIAILKIASLVYAYKEYNEEKRESELSDERYDADHEALEDVVWTDRTDGVDALFGALSSSGALSFAEDLSRELFDAQNPGYREARPGRYTDFEGDYEKRASDGRKYAYGVFEANDSEAEGILESQEEIEELNEASLAAYGYRQVLQAGSQTSNFFNQELVRLRIDMQRRLEAEARYALDEMQEDADGEASFAEGIGTWGSQSAGVNY
ncbi:MAG: hypothetical protein LBQ19_05635 [Synergistaceae bacterium]|jgi:hypothetical protein|nr:hypothetical protein [Synergistaceae bacterium]